ncbi:MAG: efflux RND transporter periplasmic adaptor subunit [Gemmatimonadaceae bacterium]|nr:efflux RND transporter periplasmic adaptor subunit [Gemmatimonadaceae bacterium]
MKPHLFRVSRTVPVALLLAVVACTKPSVPPKAPVAVTVANSTQGEAPYIVAANGVVEPLQSVAIQSQVGGVLTRVHFKEGDEVREGQVLFSIDSRPYDAALRQAQAMLARDVAQAENAKRDAERFAALVAKDYVTRSQADQATANAAALAAVVDADRATVSTQRLNLDNATIRAPITGKTGSLLVREGNLVQPGAAPPLVVINQIRPILVRFAVPDREFPQVQRYAAGRTLAARAIHSNGDGSAVPGSLSFVDNGVDSTTGTVLLKARFENGDRQLWPGQFVRVELQLFSDPAAVLVPSQAVQTSQTGTFVFTIDEKGKAVMRTVTAGRVVGDLTVIEQGLKVGERVVTDGQGKLAPGSTVAIKEAVTPRRGDAPVRDGAAGRAVDAKGGVAP